MKRFFGGLMAVMMLCLCVGCGGSENKSEDTAAPQEPAYTPSGVFYDLTGFDPRETLVTVDGSEISAELYLYWTCFTTSNLEYQLNMMNNYYGIGSEWLEEDGSLNWESSFTDEISLSDFARTQSEASVISFAVLENMAKEHGVELTEDDLTALAAQHAATVEQMGGQEVFEQNLEDLSITQETFDRIAALEYLRSHLCRLLLDKESELYMDDSAYDQFATYADHILIATKDLDTGEALSEDQVKEKTALAEDILAQLQAVEGEELLTLFAQLADEHSEDTGRAAYPNGYIYTPGTMVAEFEDAAAALAPGQISGLVESTYGYHIILRRDLAEGLANDPTQKQALAEEQLQLLLSEKAQSAQVTFSEKLQDFDTGTFYEEYLAVSAETAAAREAAAQQDSGESKAEDSDEEAK